MRGKTKAPRPLVHLRALSPRGLDVPAIRTEVMHLNPTTEIRVQENRLHPSRPRAPQKRINPTQQKTKNPVEVLDHRDPIPQRPLTATDLPNAVEMQDARAPANLGEQKLVKNCTLSHLPLSAVQLSLNRLDISPPMVIEEILSRIQHLVRKRATVS